MPVQTNKLIGNQNVRLGTCELSQAYGQASGATVTRVGSEEDFLNCNGGTLATLFKGLGWDMDHDAMFDVAIGMPELLEAVVFPDILYGGIPLAITGHVWLGTNVKWSINGQQMLGMKVKHKDSLGNNPTIGDI